MAKKNKVQDRRINKEKSRLGHCYAFSARRELARVRYFNRILMGAQSRFEFESAWKACVVQLRSVAHVLQKSDGARNAFLRASVEKRYVFWKSPKKCGNDYFGFIEDERNSLLKNGRSSIVCEVKEDGEALEFPVKIIFFGQMCLASNAISECVSWLDLEIARIEDAAWSERRVKKSMPTTRKRRTGTGKS
ncbi:hypothetical protein NHN26_10750 [Rhodovulum tesquicola]|uniref:hypothetical protein n=1 Tax=Rhodovulum tesquicola TaxID=540254 RepID=UPI0020980F66|nr:hypothetical protein [Rhodovulum tesquicola]MCO8145705.1 hypothetical protein [Rhodovulum tesquicola]